MHSPRLPAGARAPALAALVIAACSEPPAPVGALRHVLLVSLDTTRADHLGCYGAERVRTPHLDALAAEGVRFSDATAAAPTTLASHTSLMTGTWPQTHGVVRNGFRVHADNVMLAELLRDAGFHTAAVLGSFALERRFDFHQGFDHFDEEFDLLVTPVGFDQNQRLAENVTAALLAHVDEVGDDARRMFLFAHYFDAHAPYSPPAPWASEYTAEGAQPASDGLDVERAVRSRQKQMVGTEYGHAGLVNNGFQGPLRALLGRPTGDETPLDRHLADLYAGEVSYVDAAIGDLLAGLAERGLLDEMLVVVTGDHGETFWEHADLWNHGLLVYQTTVQVPLVLRFPDGRHRGVVVDGPVSSVDVLPTLCELLGLEAPARCEGTSLVPLMKGLPFERGAVFSEATQPWTVERAGEWGNLRKPQCIRQGPWKYVIAPYAGAEQLFHLERDPGEQRDLLRGAPTAEALAKRDELRAELERWRASARPLPSRFDGSQVEETRARLEAMGYSGQAPDDER